MKRNAKELKRISRDILNDRYGVPMGAFVVASIIVAAVEIPFSMSLGENPTTMQLVITLLAEYLIALISFVLNTGVILVHLNMTRGNAFKINQIFTPFREHAERFFGMAFLISLLAIACCIPGIAGAVYFYFADLGSTSIVIFIAAFIITMILGVFLSLTYNFVSFFLLDQPQSGVIASFKECRLMMHQNRGRLFYLLLSFIGWNLLIVCSLGIAALWVSPYQNETLVVFYLDCTGELDRIPVRQYSSEATKFENPLF